jgi:hypothetical protein
VIGGRGGWRRAMEERVLWKGLALWRGGKTPTSSTLKFNKITNIAHRALLGLLRF